MTRHRRRQKPRNRHKRSAKPRTGPVGRIEIARRGYAFCDTDEGSFFIPRGKLGSAMPNDTVELRVRAGKPHESDKREASVARVIERAAEYFVGVIEYNDPIAVVVSQDPRMRHDLFVTDGQTGGAKEGDIVLAHITSYPMRYQPMQGYVVEVLGSADDPGMDVDIIIHNLDLPTEFSPQAIEEAESMHLDVDAALEERGRRDLRSRDVFTIDPTDAKDFDDAISLDEVEGCLRLGVHIADVSHYVHWDSSIDVCARDRATSVYLVDRVLPMLPEKLSNDLCSLKPGQDRLAMTCDMFLDEDAKLKRYEVYPSVICSKRRFDYVEAQEILDRTHADPYEEKLRRFDALAKKLYETREKRGAIDFDSVEAKPVLDEFGRVERVDLRRNTDATSMIEEAMILANETVAGHAHGKHAPFVYRIHESPSAQALEALLPLLKDMGYSTAGLAEGYPQAFQRVLDEAKKTHDETLVNYLVLRSMERAVYSTEPIAHFGLASKCYCHFTSPIRRYPDLMVHRLLKDPRAMEGQLDWLAHHSSKMERLAEQAERDSVELKLCEYLEEHIDEEFVGTISTVVARGLFVRLDNTLEGFLLLNDLHAEHHDFDPKTQTLVGEETGRTYRLGQQIRVRVEDVDPRERNVTFTLAERP